MPKAPPFAFQTRQLSPASSIFDLEASLDGLGLTKWLSNGNGDWMTLADFNALNLCSAVGAEPSQQLRAEAHAFIPVWETQAVPNAAAVEKTVEANWRIPEHLYKCGLNDGRSCGSAGFEHERSTILSEIPYAFRQTRLVVHGAAEVIKLSNLPKGDEVPVLVTDNFFYTYNNTVTGAQPGAQITTSTIFIAQIVYP